MRPFLNTVWKFFFAIIISNTGKISENHQKLCSTCQKGLLRNLFSTILIHLSKDKPMFSIHVWEIL